MAESRDNSAETNAQNLSPEELEQLGAKFLQFLSHEMEQDSSNWKQFYSILKESCKASEEEASSQQTSHESSSKRKTSNTQQKNSHSDANTRQSRKDEKGVKVDTEATKKQYRSSDYAQKQSSTFTGLHTEQPRNNEFKTTPLSNKTKATPTTNMKNGKINDTASSRLKKTKKKQKTDSENITNNGTTTTTEKTAHQSHNRETNNHQTKTNRTTPHTYPNSNFYQEKLVDFFEKADIFFRRCFHILKETLFYIGCLILMVVLLLLKFSWHALVFLLKLIAIILLLVLVKSMQFLGYVNSRYNILTKVLSVLSTLDGLIHLITGVKVSLYFKRRKRTQYFEYDSDDSDDADVELPSLPTTSEEAVEHLLKQKSHKPFRTLCVEQNSNDNIVKNNYRKLALLVHPDKCSLDKSDEAFKVLDTAFRQISDPAKREELAQEVERRRQWKEFNRTHGEDFNKLFDELVNTIPCAACNGKHKRTLVKERNFTQARYCRDCGVKHGANDGDLWAETNSFGFGWVCYVCMDAEVYEVTEWAKCQRLHEVIPTNCHQVPCRLGNAAKQNGSQRKTTRRQQRQQDE